VEIPTSSSSTEFDATWRCRVDYKEAAADFPQTLALKEVEGFKRFHCVIASRFRGLTKWVMLQKLLENIKLLLSESGYAATAKKLGMKSPWGYFS